MKRLVTILLKIKPQKIHHPKCTWDDYRNRYSNLTISNSAICEVMRERRREKK